MKTAPTSVDKYIAAQPKTIQPLLKELRRTIKEAAPDAEESISYRMPAYKQHGVVVYFSVHTNHIGLYPVTEEVRAAFSKEVAPYVSGKGTLQFPLDKPIPRGLVKKVVRFRVKENLEKVRGRR